MRSKAPLALMEQAIMVLVFALAAALCLRAFFWSDAQSNKNQVRDQAVLQAQNAAEAIKHTQGDFAQAAQLISGEWDGAVLTAYFDDQWQPTSNQGEFILQVSPQQADTPLLGRATVTVYQDTAPLFQLSVAWQEVA